jgi:hypothetical protein
MSSRQLDDLNEEQSDNLVAGLLGISVEDYQRLDHSGIQDVTSNNGLVYSYYIQFNDNSPKEILNKIKGIDSTNTVYFDTGLLDR